MNECMEKKVTEFANTYVQAESALVLDALMDFAEKFNDVSASLWGDKVSVGVGFAHEISLDFSLTALIAARLAYFESDCGIDEHRKDAEELAELLRKSLTLVDGYIDGERHKLPASDEITPTVSTTY